jgi:uncharacterized protein YycO
MILLPGDVCLYRSSGFYGRVIALKTWHPIAHVECYVGNAQSVASRNGIGTGLYPVRTQDLAIVCRPKVPIDIKKAMRWFGSRAHRPYGWLDLLQFVGLDIDAPGIVCSPFVTEFLRAGGLDPFNGEPAAQIAPFEFEISNVFDKFPFTPGVMYA